MSVEEPVAPQASGHGGAQDLDAPLRPGRGLEDAARPRELQSRERDGSGRVTLLDLDLVGPGAEAA